MDGLNTLTAVKRVLWRRQGVVEYYLDSLNRRQNNREMSSRIARKPVQAEYRNANGFLRAIRWMTDIYLILLICVYPFLVYQGYGSTSHIKYGFLIAISYALKIGAIAVPTFIPVVLVLMAAGTHAYLRDSKTSVIEFVKKIRLSAVDIFVLLYLFSLIISSLLCSYKSELIWGYPTWNMGLASQFLFIMLYFIISVFFDLTELELMVYLALLSSGIVFVIAVLQRFGLDVFGLYGNTDDILGYLSTIGQVTWFSTYMIIFFMIGLFIVWYFDKSTLIYKAGVLHLLIASACLVTQNSDSAFAGLFIAMAFLFWWSFDSNERMCAFCESSLLILIIWRIVGFVQKAMGDRLIQLDRISVFMSQSPIMWGLIAAIALFYVFLRLRTPRGFDISRYSVIGRCFVIAVFVLIAALIVYIVLNTKGVLPEKMIKESNYFIYDPNWGHFRGGNWHDAVVSLMMELKAEPLKGIFGAGADQYYHVTEAYESGQIRQIFGETVATNAHNEWLTAFVNFGLFGGCVYLGIFISSVAVCIKNRKTVPYVLAVALCALAYVAHDLFCYQQYISAPYIFIIIGTGSQLIKSEEQ